MGQTEIEELLKDGRRRTEKEISKELDIRIANINRCLKQMLKSNQVGVIKADIQIRGRNNHFYEKEVKHWFIIRIHRIKSK